MRFESMSLARCARLAIEQAAELPSELTKLALCGGTPCEKMRKLEEGLSATCLAALDLMAWADELERN